MRLNIPPYAFKTENDRQRTSKACNMLFSHALCLPTKMLFGSCRCRLTVAPGKPLELGHGMSEQCTKQVRQRRLRGKPETTTSQYLAYARQGGYNQDK